MYAPGSGFPTLKNKQEDDQVIEEDILKNILLRLGVHLSNNSSLGQNFHFSLSLRACLEDE